jgi:hypothetical protein
MNISFIAFGTVDFLAAFRITFVLTIWISSQILMCTIGSSWVAQIHRLSFFRLMFGGGLGDTAISRFYFNIRALVKSLWNSFSPASNDGLVDWYIKWNNNKYSCIIIKNIFGSLVRSEFCSIIRNTFDHYLAGFSCFIQKSWEPYFFVNNFFFSFLAKKINSVIHIKKRH